MSRESREILIVEIAERAKIQGRFGENPVGRWANVTVSERQLEVIELNDFVEWEKGAIFVAGRGRDRKGKPLVQLWWAQPKCPKCRKSNILQRIEGSDDWVIECCGEKREGGVRDLCVGWIGYSQRAQSSYWT